MESDDKDAKERRGSDSPRKKKASLFRRAASFVISRSRKQQPSTDALEISENRYPLGAINQNIEESEPGQSNPDSTNDSLLPDSELMSKTYSFDFSELGMDLPLLELVKKMDPAQKDKSVVTKSETMKNTDSLPPKDERRVDPRLTGSGIRNLGRTCFMNSVLQCLVHTVPLHEAILSENHSLRCTCVPSRRGFCFSCYMRNFFRSSTSGKRRITPWGLANSLRYFSGRFSRGQQADAHEFLLMMWARLKERHDKDSMYESLIKRGFCGLVSIKLTCCGCKWSSERIEELYDMQLPIQKTDNLIEAILSYTVAKVDYSCERCRKEEGGIQKVTFHEVPPIATFQLKRFGNDMKKIEKHVSFPLVLDLLPFTAERDAEMKYELYAVIVHQGSTLKEGHYYCLIQIGPDFWFRFDDERVSRASIQEVLSQKAYVLFYAKEGTGSFIDSIIAHVGTPKASASSAAEIEAPPLTGTPDAWMFSDDNKYGVYSVDTYIDDGTYGVYSVDPSTASDIDDGKHEGRLAAMGEDKESEDVEARKRA